VLFQVSEQNFLWFGQAGFDKGTIDQVEGSDLEQMSYQVGYAERIRIQSESQPGGDG
jgi:hypothetical protein